MRGTGSHDVAVHDAFVPAAYSVSPGDPVSLDHPIARVPIIPMAVAGLAAQMLGVGACALETVVEMARTRVTPGPTPDLRDRAEAQAGVACHGAALDAARAHMHACARRLWSAVQQGSDPTPTDRGALYTASLHAVDAARAAVDAMYALGGTQSLYVHCPLERAHRDIHAMSRHVAAQPVWCEDTGRVIFGLEPTNPQYAL